MAYQSDAFGLGFMGAAELSVSGQVHVIEDTACLVTCVLVHVCSRHFREQGLPRLMSAISDGWNAKHVVIL